LALLIVGPRPAAMFASPGPWIKLGYALSLAASAALLTARLARPVARLTIPQTAVAAVFVAMALVGTATVLGTAQGERAAAILGQAWFACPWLLMGLSLPALGAIFWAVRGLAPTRLRKAGFSAGLLAGAIGAAGYALACPEASAAFVAIWYTLGIGLTAALGAALGPRVLRW